MKGKWIFFDLDFEDINEVLVRANDLQAFVMGFFCAIAYDRTGKLPTHAYLEAASQVQTMGEVAALIREWMIKYIATEDRT